MNQDIKMLERDNLIRYLKERQIRLLDNRYYQTDKTKEQNTIRYSVIDELIDLIGGYRINEMS